MADKANRTGQSETARGHVLGDRAHWNKVAYNGAAHAPSDRTYGGVNPRSMNYTHRADSGVFPGSLTNGALANLVPLVLSAMWESAFAREAGPLSTWSN